MGQHYQIRLSQVCKGGSLEHIVIRWRVGNTSPTTHCLALASQNRPDMRYGAGIRLAREKQANLRVIPTSAAIGESVELAHEFSNRVFRKVGSEFPRFRCPLAPTGPDAIPQGRSLGFGRAIARPLPRSSLCVRDSRRPDRGRSCRARNIAIPDARSRGRLRWSQATSQTTP